MKTTKIKNLLLSLLFCSSVLVAHAQEASVERSIFGTQLGIDGIWVNNELRLGNLLALRSELGMEGYHFLHRTNSGYAYLPAISLEPRFYYSINKRAQKDKRVDGNSGDFFSLKTTYYADWFEVTNYLEGDVEREAGLFITPTWGIRRSIGSHFNFEASGGPRIIIGDNVYYEANNYKRLEVQLSVRLGYQF